MKRATVISLVGHGAILAWALISFARPLEKIDGEMFPADVLTAEEFNKIAAGDPNKEISEKPKRVVDKIDTPTPPLEDPTASVDKKAQTASTEVTNPEPSPPAPDPKPAAAPPEAKAEAQTPEKKEPEQKVDPIAEALKKEEEKKPEKKAEVKPQPVKKPEPQQSKFDPRLAQAQIDKRKPTRVASAGTEINNTVSRGSPKGVAPQLTGNELAMIQRRLTSNWNLPVDNRDIVVGIFIRLRIDGTLAAEPEITTRGNGPAYDAVKRSARAAVYASVPFEFLKPDRYENWKELDLDFIPKK